MSIELSLLEVEQQLSTCNDLEWVRDQLQDLLDTAEQLIADRYDASEAEALRED